MSNQQQSEDLFIEESENCTPQKLSNKRAANDIVKQQEIHPDHFQTRQNFFLSSSNKKRRKIKNVEINPYETFIHDEQISAKLTDRIEQPKEDYSTFIDKPMTKRKKKQFQELVSKLMDQNKLYETEVVFTFKPLSQHATKMSKLISIIPNKKNSKNLIYHPLQGTVISSYPCQFCQKVFMKASGLGGHISKCKIKIAKQKSENSQKQKQNELKQEIIQQIYINQADDQQ